MADARDAAILRLARLNETLREEVVRQLSQRLAGDDEIRRILERLAPAQESPGNRLAEEIRRLAGAREVEAPPGHARSALLELFEIERATEDLYRHYERVVRDPDAARLLRNLSHSEAARVRVAEDALRAFDRRAQAPGAARMGPSSAPGGMGGPGAPEEVPLREGVSDFGGAD